MKYKVSVWESFWNDVGRLVHRRPLPLTRALFCSAWTDLIIIGNFRALFLGRKNKNKNAVEWLRVCTGGSHSSGPFTRKRCILGRPRDWWWISCPGDVPLSSGWVRRAFAVWMSVDTRLGTKSPACYSISERLLFFLFFNRAQRITLSEYIFILYDDAPLPHPTPPLSPVGFHKSVTRFSKWEEEYSIEDVDRLAFLRIMTSSRSLGCCRSKTWRITPRIRAC